MPIFLRLLTLLLLLLLPAVCGPPSAVWNGLEACSTAAHRLSSAV